MTKGKDKTVFHERLKQLLEESGHNQVWLARTLGFSTPSVNGWTQDSEPSYTTLCKIAKLFGVTTDYLLGLTDSKSTDFSFRACAQLLGLTDQAVHSLIVYRGIIGTQSTQQLETISAIIEDRDFVLTLDDFFRVKGEKFNSPLKEDLLPAMEMLNLEKILWNLRNEIHEKLEETLAEDENYLRFISIFKKQKELIETTLQQGEQND